MPQSHDGPDSSPPTPKTTLHQPRILCLHGGGVNAEVFALQFRALSRTLSDHFRLVFVDAPFLSEPHPAITAVYGDRGPFRRWLRWQPEHAVLDAATASREIMGQLQQCMEEDDEKGATGAWVGILGFSQGAKIAASVAFTQQLQCETFGDGEAIRKNGGTDWKFAVLMAGRAPLVVLDEKIEVPPGCAAANESSADYEPVGEDELAGNGHVLRLPTVHVHGLRDPSIELHRLMMKTYCGEGRLTRVVEWDGGHRVPIKGADVEAVTSCILRLAADLGVVGK